MRLSQRLVTLAVLTPVLAHASDGGLPVIASDQLLEALGSKRPPQVIDVRSAEEFEREHIPGSVNIPVGKDTSTFAAQLPKPLDSALVFYCNGPT